MIQGASVNVLDYGATGDGVTDDAPSIQLAVDALHALGGGSLYFPSGTYLLSTTQGVHHIFIRPRSNIMYYGDGRSSILKADNNVINFNFFRCLSDDPVSTTLSNVIFKDLTFDGNGTNNLAPVGGAVDQVAIGTNIGSNIVIDNVYCHDFSGRQILSFGSTVAGVHQVSELTIVNCEIKNVATAVTGNINQTDHSSIYFEADNVVVSNNILTNDNIGTPYAVSTAIEGHTTGANVQSNIIKYYNIGVIASAQVANNYNFNIQNNNINAAVAFRMYLIAPYTFDNLVFDGNTCVQYGFRIPGAPFVDLSSDVTANVSGSVYITNNLFRGAAISADSYASMNCVEFGTINYLNISNNSFTNIMGRPISSGTIYSDNYVTLEIKNNNFYRCNRTTDTGYKECIAMFVSPIILDDVLIEGNTFNSSSASFSTKALNGNCYVNQMIIKNNSVVGAGFSDEFTWIDLPYPSSKLGYSLVQHSSSTGIVPSMPANVASTWADTKNGYSYIRIRDGVISTNWNKVIYTYSIPTTGTNLTGDRSVNANPAVGQPKGWICTAGGTPGTWVSEGNL